MEEGAVGGVVHGTLQVRESVHLQGQARGAGQGREKAVVVGMHAALRQEQGSKPPRC
jgi:hypothetical protein